MKNLNWKQIAMEWWFEGVTDTLANDGYDFEPAELEALLNANGWTEEATIKYYELNY